MKLGFGWTLVSQRCAGPKLLDSDTGWFLFYTFKQLPQQSFRHGYMETPSTCDFSHKNGFF